jgi:hypothetical protein
MIDNSCHRKKFISAKLKTILIIIFYIIFVVDRYGIWTSFKWF